MWRLLLLLLLELEFIRTEKAENSHNIFMKYTRKFQDMHLFIKNKLVCLDIFFKAPCAYPGIRRNQEPIYL